LSSLLIHFPLGVNPILCSVTLRLIVYSSYHRSSISPIPAYITPPDRPDGAFTPAIVFPNLRDLKFTTKMPIFCGADQDPASLHSTLPTDDVKGIEGYGSPREQSGRSISPESGGIILTTNDGRPISRGEVIERLKRGESPTWTIRHNSISPKQTTPPQEISRKSPSTILLPSPELSERDVPEDTDQSNNTKGLEIERPRSALHSGDFRSERDGNSTYDHISSPLSVSPPAPWHSSFSSTFSSSRSYGNRRSSGLSTSPLSNLLLLPPTSPLIHASSNPDLDPPLERQRSRSPDNRRYSFSMHSAQVSRSFSGTPSPMRASALYHPYQAHQPCRTTSTPQTPRLRPRGISVSSEQSPLHHAPMVGSYEESILRGRMSTTPSKPLNFIAQVGVLGRGKCKPSLRCPPHATVSFPAVFYSYSSNGRSVDNQPSPYVGLIDIEHSFPKHDLRSPTGGSYRIPQQGQLQIIIKNPNKTAVKLFLVPYDLSDMEPGQKTFIRQRSYSAGPVVDMPINTHNVQTDRHQTITSPTSLDALAEKPILRYLIHLNICCTGKGRYYLFKSIRVVFANRVPDGKEKLRNEIQYPDPKYSTYKPTREIVHSNPHISLASALRSTDKSARRRSTPFSFGVSSLDQVDGITSSPRQGLKFDMPEATPPRQIKPIPFSLQRPITSQTELSNIEPMELDTVRHHRGPWVMDPNEGVELTTFNPNMDWVEPSIRDKPSSEQ
jgi:uncharacterized protein DUF4210/putative protein required for chromosome segregation during meiosis